MKPTVSASPLRAARSRGVRPVLSGRFRSAPASTRSRTAPFWPFRQAQLSAVSPSWSAEVREAPGNTNRASIAFCSSNTISKREGICVEGGDSHPLTAGALQCSCGPQRKPASVQCDPACRWHWYLYLVWAATPQPGEGRKNRPGECHKDRAGEIKRENLMSRLFTCVCPCLVALSSGTIPLRLGISRPGPRSSRSAHTSSLPLPDAAVSAGRGVA